MPRCLSTLRDLVCIPPADVEESWLWRFFRDAHYKLWEQQVPVPLRHQSHKQGLAALVPWHISLMLILQDVSLLLPPKTIYWNFLLLLFFRNDEVFIRRHAFAIHKYSPFTSKSDCLMMRGKKSTGENLASVRFFFSPFREMKAEKKKKKLTIYFKGKIWLHLEDNTEEKYNLFSSNSDRLISFVSTSVVKS